MRARVAVAERQHTRVTNGATVRSLTRDDLTQIERVLGARSVEATLARYIAVIEDLANVKLLRRLTRDYRVALEDDGQLPSLVNEMDRIRDRIRVEAPAAIRSMAALAWPPDAPPWIVETVLAALVGRELSPPRLPDPGSLLALLAIRPAPDVNRAGWLLIRSVELRALN